MLRRFVPLRHKDDVEGLDRPEDVVRPSQQATVKLNYAFIKYFRDFGGAKREGEIAVVLSFESGRDARNSFLVYSSQGQTLGSFLDFQDWNAIGPIPVTGPALSMRIVIIELDQVENEQTKQFVRSAATTVATFAPSVAGVAPIATAVADFIIGQNKDDVVFDQRFTLAQVDDGTPIYSSPLLYGKYVAVSQEDRLSSTGAADGAAFSTLPLSMDSLRYDLDSDRLFKAYTYQLAVFDDDGSGDPQVRLPPDADLVDADQWAAAYWDSIYTSGSAKDLARLCGPREPSEGDVSASDINSADAKGVRRRLLGFPYDGRVSRFDARCSLQSALAEIVYDSARYTGGDLRRSRLGRHSAGRLTREEILTSALDRDSRIFLEYPVVNYMAGHTILAQYPFHTHFVFSVERSYGETDKPYHGRFPEYQKYLEKELEAARSQDEVAVLTEVLAESVKAQKKRTQALKKLKIMPKEAKVKDKVCVLFNGLVPKTGKAALGNAEILDEIFVVSGEVFSTPDQARDYLNSDPEKKTAAIDEKAGTATCK